LSACGLGYLDETEVDTIPGARIAPKPAPLKMAKLAEVAEVAHDPQTGEISNYTTDLVQESALTPAAEPESPSAPTGLEYGAEENLTDRIERLDKELGVAAAKGMASLEEAWDNIDKDDKRMLKAALDKRHKITAAQVDRLEATG
jgi:hypothetical protein